MMVRMFVIVLTGGRSAEREISFRSGAAIQQALENRGHTVKAIDYADDVAVLKDELLRADAVVPALHGKGGEDGALQAQLEALGVCFVGSDSESSRLCMDKWQYKRRIRAALPTPAGELVGRETMWESALAKQPFVLKPNDGGSSIDTFIVTDPQKADRQKISAAFARNPEMLLEELIPGVEITVGVLGDEALPVVEIIPPPDGEFDYENKYNGKTQELCPPLHVSPENQKEAQRLSLLAHRLCGCRDLSRTDLFVTPGGELSIIETNTFPGMTNQSLYPKEAAVAGIPMDELVDRLARMALSRRT